MRKNTSDINPSEIVDALANTAMRYRQSKHVGEVGRINTIARSLVPLLDASGRHDLALRLIDACRAHNLDREGGMTTFTRCLDEVRTFIEESV